MGAYSNCRVLLRSSVGYATPAMWANFGRCIIAPHKNKQAIPVNASFSTSSLPQPHDRLSETEMQLRAAIGENSSDARLYKQLGDLLSGQARSSEAESAFLQALSIDPEFAAAHNNLANLYATTGRFDEAELAYRRALVLRADFAEAHGNLGGLMHTLKRVDEAERAYRQALSLRADLPDTLLNLASLLYDDHRFGEAEAAYRQLLRVRPGNVAAQLGWASVLNALNRYSEGIEVCGELVASCPMNAEAHYTLGTLLENEERFSDAEDAYRKALALRPDHHYACFNLALVLLRMSRFDEGWSLYESRNQPGIPNAVRLPLGDRCKEWRGEPLEGKSILVCGEQGHGDIIQFGRYFSLLKDLGAAYVAFACRPPLRSLFRGACDIDALLDPGIPPVRRFDFATFLLSVPLRAGHRSIPDADWLRADPSLVDEWRTRLASLGGYKVGIVWKGNPDHPNDCYRSLVAVNMLAPLWEIPGISFVSLQKGAGEHEASSLQTRFPIYDAAVHVRDFADTAAIIAHLDLVISVDTAVAHLAGALGKPCWILVSRPRADWRWGLEAERTPWYPSTTRLFRQAVPGDWKSVVEQVGTALSNAVSYQFALRESSSRP
ncbi:tetratricopeptide repeat-containing glycosyltransferase family protein [Caballeronia sp. INDeC2]|uniref:tetratricopeptide repeat-containing glycosyltransferase family protein n=1 Tax=Caballeronia sp. INDeC2 TaxID=2921747 RepID=UPI0020287BB5|nr:tetratricopeptide repeat-containing glycosyltransferase family protein [Caballeronia sp. INDeC2]